MSVVTDNFNRAGPALGANWTNIKDSVVIDSSIRFEPASTDTDGAAIWTANTFTNDQYAQCVVTTISTDSYIGVIVRGSAGPNFYFFYGNSTNWELDKNVAGSTTQIITGTWSASANDVIRLEVVGSTLRALRNGSVVTTQTDTALTSGSPGIVGYTDAVQDGYGDSFEGGDWSSFPAVLRMPSLHVYDFWRPRV